MSLSKFGAFSLPIGWKPDRPNADVAMHFPTFDFGANKQKLAREIGWG